MSKKYSLKLSGTTLYILQNTRREKEIAQYMCMLISFIFEVLAYCN